MRAQLAGTWYRYLYNGDRVLEELNDSGGTLGRYTTVNDSYYDVWLGVQRNDGRVRFPLYNVTGTVRRLVDTTAAITDTYSYDTFGKGGRVSGTTPNPYQFGGAWGYITDPSAMLQLGARFYWPEVGRFVSQDPMHGAPDYPLRRSTPARTVVPSHWNPVRQVLLTNAAVPVPTSDNLYLYAAGNPLTHRDPNGHCITAVIAVVLIIAIIAYMALTAYNGEMDEAHTEAPDPNLPPRHTAAPSGRRGEPSSLGIPLD